MDKNSEVKARTDMPNAYPVVGGAEEEKEAPKVPAGNDLPMPLQIPSGEADFADAKAKTVAPLDGKHLRILLAEDEELILDTLADLLIEAGFQVSKARNGEEARDMALSEKPDLLLWDIQMPRMTGLEALKEVRQDPWGKNVPVVLLTNIGDVRNVAGALELQAYDYLIKSDMSLDDVVHVVRRKFSTVSQ